MSTTFIVTIFHVFDLGIALKYMQNIRSGTKVGNSSFWKLATRMCVKIFDGQIIQKTPSPATEDSRKDIFSIHRILPRRASTRHPRSCVEEDATLDSDDVAKRPSHTESRVHAAVA